MDKREAELKSAFTEELGRTAPGLLTLRYLDAGAPDRSLIGFARQTNWEFKHGTPDFDSMGLQELMCCRMAAAGHCRYVIWQETYMGIGQRTLIVHPNEMHRRTDFNPKAEISCVGFDMKWLVVQVLKAHNVIL